VEGNSQLVGYRSWVSCSGTPVLDTLLVGRAGESNEQPSLPTWAGRPVHITKSNGLSKGNQVPVVVVVVALDKPRQLVQLSLSIGCLWFYCVVILLSLPCVFFVTPPLLIHSFIHSIMLTHSLILTHLLTHPHSCLISLTQSLILTHSHPCPYTHPPPSPLRVPPGYGRSTPLSDTGKAFSILYALLGVPFTMLVLTASVQRLMYPLVHAPMALFQRAGLDARPASSVHFALLLALLALCFFVAPAFVFSAVEGSWTFLDATYFCFMSLYTVGLGDYVPGEQPDQKYRSLYKVLVIGESLASLA